MTPTERIYCLDTSALLFMADTYSADMFPEVWEHLTELAHGEVVMAPREVHRELQRKEDNGALTWAKANRKLFRPLDAGQSSVAGAIVSSPRFQGLIDLDAELPDADPFVVALAVTHRTELLATALPAVVGVNPARVRVSLEEVCEEESYPVRFLTPYEMLREIDIEVPKPGGRGLADLYGIWKGVEFTEEEIAAVKLGAWRDQ